MGAFNSSNIPQPILKTLEKNGREVWHTPGRFSLRRCLFASNSQVSHKGYDEYNETKELGFFFVVLCLLSLFV
jgi:hypothetical protein